MQWLIMRLANELAYPPVVLCVADCLCVGALMGMCRCIKCGNCFDSKNDAGDILYPGYKGDSWACYACHEKEADKQDEPDNEALRDGGQFGMGA